MGGRGGGVNGILRSGANHNFFAAIIVGHRCTDEQWKDKQTEGRTNRKTDRQTDGQTDRLTEDLRSTWC